MCTSECTLFSTSDYQSHWWWPILLIKQSCGKKIEWLFVFVWMCSLFQIFENIKFNTDHFTNLIQNYLSSRLWLSISHWGSFRTYCLDICKKGLTLKILFKIKHLHVHYCYFDSLSLKWIFCFRVFLDQTKTFWRWLFSRVQWRWPFFDSICVWACECECVEASVCVYVCVSSLSNWT